MKLKKTSIILITLFAVVGAILIYKFTETPKDGKISNNNITNKYAFIGDNNVFENKSINEINDIVGYDTGIIFFCIPENDWCQYYIKFLNEAAIDNGIDKIYCSNIKQDRQYNTQGYRKLVKKLDEFLNKDDEGNKRLFVPTLVFVKNGNIIFYDDETSMMNKEFTPPSYFNDEKINEFYNKLNNYILQYKEEL